MKVNEMGIAENYLQELIKIDANDSTGYSELGIFYLQTKNFELAAKNFETAVRLGPPGTGMNAYQIANHIYKSPFLFEQLEEDEKTIIKNII
jgi:Flp pilus assembly protein TadD